MSCTLQAALVVMLFEERYNSMVLRKLGLTFLFLCHVVFMRVADAMRVVVAVEAVFAHCTNKRFSLTSTCCCHCHVIFVLHNRCGTRHWSAGWTGAPLSWHCVEA
jgi:hypothetical protein